MHPEPEVAARSRMHSFTAGFKKPFRKKNKDSPKLSPRPMPKNSHSPLAPRRTVEPSLSSPLLKNKVEKQPEGTNNVPVQRNGAKQQPQATNNVPRVTPRPKRPPPPKPPAPYRKKSATYVQLEENSAFQPENGASNKREADISTKRSAQSSTEKSEDKQPGNNNDEEPEVVPFLYEVPVSQHSTLETITEGDGTNILKPVAPPRRRKNNGASPIVAPKVPHGKVSLGRIPKAASTPIIYNGDSSTIVTRKTSDVVVAVQPPKYTEEELEKCSVSDQHLLFTTFL